MTTFKHPKGKTWSYDFWWKGRRYTGSTDQLTKDDADLVEAEIKKRLRQQAWGIAPVERKHTPTFSAWASHFLTHKRKRLGRPDLIERTLKLVLAFFGTRPAKHPIADAPYHNLRLADPILDADWLVKFEQWMDDRGIAGATKNTYRSALSGMYKLAIRPAWRKKTNVTVNPCIGMERDARRSRKSTLTPDQLRAWITAAPHHVRLALAIGALAPELRLASILALRWDKHISPDLARITIDQHKTARSTGEPQVMPIDPQLRAILLPEQRAAKKARATRLIRYRGEPVASIRTALTRAARDAGIPYGRDGITFHSLRHTAATMLAELGVPEKQRQETMGHSDIRTTQGYTHLRPHHKQAPLAALSQALQLETALQGQLQGPADRTRKNAHGKRRVARSRSRGDAAPKSLPGQQLPRTTRQNS